MEVMTFKLKYFGLESTLCFPVADVLKKRYSDPCWQMADTGPCEAAMTRYFYDKSTGKCESFLYGGCEGNINNFESYDACQKACSSEQQGSSAR